jgi:ABC-type metal ion transport system substrate-binding protein
MADASTTRRLVRLSDALRDAVQNPKTFQITPDEAEALTRILERVDQLISRSRKM